MSEEDEPVCDIKLFLSTAEGYHFTPETFKTVSLNDETKLRMASQILEELYQRLIPAIKSLSDDELKDMQKTFADDYDNWLVSDPMNTALIKVILSRRHINLDRSYG